MFAQVDDRIGIPALSVTQPAVKCIIVMRWRQVGNMVDRIWVHAIATRRL